MSQIYPGFGGWLLFGACTGAVFMAGARLMEVTRKDSRQRRRRTDYFPETSKNWRNSRQLAAARAMRRPAAQLELREMAEIRRKIRLARLLLTLRARVSAKVQGSKTMTNFTHSITAALGALLISTMFVAAAVGPAAAVSRASPGSDFGSGQRLIRRRRPDGTPPWPAARPPPKPHRTGNFRMSIFSRTRDIIAANVIDLVERSDDPAKTIRVIILEMEETLVEVRASAARCIADQKEKRRQIAQLAGLQDSWTERAELALSKGRDDLARPR